MSDGLYDALTIVTAVGSGLNAGVFFAFSVFVMKALAELPPASAVAAMQSINVEAPTPWFMTALNGTALLSVALAVTSRFRLDEPEGLTRLIGSLLYLVVIVVTGTYHMRGTTRWRSSTRTTRQPPCTGRPTSTNGRRSTTSAPSALWPRPQPSRSPSPPTDDRLHLDG